MMHQYIISLQMNKIDQNLNSLNEAIKSLGSWVKIQKTLWFVTTDKTADQTRECLDQYVDPYDLIFVAEIKKDADCSWRLHPDVNSYLLDARK